MSYIGIYRYRISTYAKVRRVKRSGQVSAACDEKKLGREKVQGVEAEVDEGRRWPVTVVVLGDVEATRLR